MTVKLFLLKEKEKKYSDGSLWFPHECFSREWCILQRQIFRLFRVFLLIKMKLSLPRLQIVQYKHVTATKYRPCCAEGSQQTLICSVDLHGYVEYYFHLQRCSYYDCSLPQYLITLMPGLTFSFPSQQKKIEICVIKSELILPAKWE